MKAEVSSPRAPSQWRPAAMNKKVQIEDVCGVGEDRSSWRISGSRWPRTHHRHEAFDGAPTPAQGFSQKTCLKGTTLWSKCFRMSRAAAAEMMVAAEVPRMAVHSATVARRKRSHSESGIRCRGSSSFRVILVAVKPVNFGRLKLNCAVMLSWVLPKSSLHSSWKTQFGCPKFSQMWSSTCYCHNTSGPPQSTCPPQLQEPWRGPSAPGSSALDHWIALAGHSSRGRCAGSSFREAFPCLVARLSLVGGLLRRGRLHPSLLMAWWVDGRERMRTSRLLRRLPWHCILGWTPASVS